MKRCSLLLFVCIIGLFGVLCSSNHNFLSTHRNVMPEKSLSPAKRSLLSDATKGHDTALVAALDGTIYLLKVGSMEPLWSFSSGPEIYSSYQAPTNDKENLSITKSRYFIDCGDDWLLYWNGNLGPLKLEKSVEEFVNSTPLIAEDGGIILGSKRTTIFLIDAKTGRVIHTYRMSDSSMTVHNNIDFPHSTTFKEMHTNLTTDELPIYITRTDYKLSSFLPNSEKVMWTMTVAEIGAAFLCQGIEKSLRGTLLDFVSSDTGLPYNMPLPCESRARVYRLRNYSLQETLSTPKGLPKAHQQDTMLPASTPDVFPSQPNVKKVLKSFNSAKFHDSHDNQDLKAVLPSNAIKENRAVPRVQDGEVFYNDGYKVRGKFSMPELILISVSLLVAFISYFNNLVSRIKLTAQFTSTRVVNQHSKRKRPRKPGKGGNDYENQDKEDKESENNFWLNLKQPIFGSTDGRKMGKLFVSNKEIAKGSNGTIVLEGIYEGRAVAVKRLLRSLNDVALKEIQNLIVSDRHPNIIRWYGVEQDQDFVYLALERCACNLSDLILMHLKSFDVSILGEIVDTDFAAEGTILLDSTNAFMNEIELWKSNGYPSPLLLKLMRDVVSGIAHLHELGIVHRDLKPQNVLIISEMSLCAKVSDMGISKQLVGDMSSLSNHDTGSGSSGWQAPEQLLLGRQTRAVDLFSLGCVLFYCITGGRHPFGNRLERDSNIAKGQVDLFLVEHIPEAMDLFSRLLDSDAEKRPKAMEVLYHPLFWNAEMRLSFLHDTSDRVELEDREINSDILKELESITSLALGTKWNEKLEPSFLNNIGRYRRYKFDSVRDLLRVMRNKLNHYRELPVEIQEIIGEVPEGFNGYFTSRFPKLLIEVYKVMHKYCRSEKWFAKFFKCIEE